MIEHTVTFCLSHPAGSPEEANFLEAAATLSRIPGVRDFRIRRQVSDKHPHAFGITMRFATQEEYDAYRGHPIHNEFVRERWLEEVTDFQEADFLEL